MPPRKRGSFLYFQVMGRLENRPVADVSLTKGEVLSTVWLDFSMWGVFVLR